MNTAAGCALLLLAFAARTAGPQLLGRVLDEEGHPAGGAIVSLRSAVSGRTQLTIAAPDGTYAVAALNAGEDYEIHADAGPLASVVHTVRLSSASEIARIDLAVGARIRFERADDKAGLNFTTRTGAAGHAWQPEIMGGGLAALDFDQDGCMDLFATSGASLPGLTKTGPEYSNRLFRNRCDGTFIDVTERAGVAGEGYSIGASSADFDNDGFPDLLVTSVQGVTLYRNRGDGTFENVTAHAHLDRPHPKYGRMWSVSAAWFDFDRDGKLDLFVTNYVAWKPPLDVCTLSGAPYYCAPGVYPGLPNQLFRNNGDGTFTDVSDSSGIGTKIGKGMGVAVGDFDDDGLPDIFVANDSSPNFLFRNNGNGTFQEVAAETGVAWSSGGNAVAGMGADFRDFDNDGRDDIALDAMYFDTFPLYRNGGKKAGFMDTTISSGIALLTRNLTGWGMGLFDFDNDGNKDLFFAASHFPGSRPFIHAEAELTNHVLRNLGTGAFEDVSAEAGAGFQEQALFHGAAFADFDNDGRVDVAVSALNGSLRLFRNVSPGPAHWLALRLKGVSSNRQGLGARVRVTLPPGARLYNHATTAVGYASSSEPLVRFGLGPWDFVPEIEIRWPGGIVQMIRNVKCDAVLDVTEAALH